MDQERQCADRVLMVRPAAFGANPETAATNRFQVVETAGPDAAAAALAEFDALVAALAGAGVTVDVFDDTPSPAKPDAIFPNNWLTTHADGRVFLYPMQAESRRAERRMDIVEALSGRCGCRVSGVEDLSHLEARGEFLEGTGSLVLDRPNRVAYAALSARTHPAAAAEFAQLADYELILFDAADEHGAPVYHTNVLMSIGNGCAVICDEAITNEAQRLAVLASLSDTGRRVLRIRRSQMRAMAGNLLELAGAGGRGVIALSRRALAALDERQARSLADGASLLPVAVDTIERVGGGSVRCMLAENFLPRRARGGAADG